MCVDNNVKDETNSQVCRWLCKEILDFQWLKLPGSWCEAPRIRLWNPWPGSTCSRLVSRVPGLILPSTHQPHSCLLLQPLSQSSKFNPLQHKAPSLLPVWDVPCPLYLKIASFFPNTASLSTPWPCTIISWHSPSWFLIYVFIICHCVLLNSFSFVCLLSVPPSLHITSM